MAAYLNALLRAKLRCRLALHAHAHLTPRSRPPPRHHATFFLHSPLAVPARGLAATASKKDIATVVPISKPDARVAGDGNMQAAAKKKEAKIVTATKKGAAVLDPHIPDDMKKSWHVLQAGNEIYDATLNQTNVGANNNKFFIIQL